MTSLRVSAAAFPLVACTPAAWVARFRAQARVAADAGARIVVFPEYVTAGLLAASETSHTGTHHAWADWTELWLTTARACARELNLLVVAGTHLVAGGDGQLSGMKNRCALAWPDGSLDHQDKLHPTPWERRWQVQPTAEVRIFEFDGVRFAVPICYDVEFPEGVRAATVAGAELLLVPSWTDDDHGFWRVRHCAQARCIENVVYVAHAPLVGSLSEPPDFEQACGAAGILTPCDTGFHRSGLAADGGWNQTVVVTAELDFERLRRIRTDGTVTPFADRRLASGYVIC